MTMTNLISEYSCSYAESTPWSDLDEYADSFKEVIKQREKIKIPFLHTSPQLECRPRIVKYLRERCIERKYSHCSLHLAVYLLDTFMDGHNVVPGKILLVANVCLLLAVKFEENTRNVPKISELNALVQNCFTVDEHKQLEMRVLEYFCWYIKFPTAAHYTHYYMKAAITQQDLTQCCEDFRGIFYRIHSGALEYLHHVIDNIHYMQEFRPSEIAAGIIAISRAECGLSPWSHRLHQVTDYTSEDIRGPFYTLHINKYSQTVDALTLYPSSICTFRENYCGSCGIQSCPKCSFLRKI
ncbi:cyclin-J isoform X1 [Euwallacea similis]|uniref:cyclin-J isoform X1 n=1 Tax=Euwallacea similis TaxID=1736056 RepID=UPI00344DF297